eukprot:COSAG05_NODE_3187_length_2258_cov_1.250116_2_plen_78_part_01
MPGAGGLQHREFWGALAVGAIVLAPKPSIMDTILQKAYTVLINENGCFFLSLFRLHVYHDRVGGEGGFLENTIRTNLP